MQDRTALFFPPVSGALGLSPPLDCRWYLYDSSNEAERKHKDRQLNKFWVGEIDSVSFL